MELKIAPLAPEDDYKPPSYSRSGRILVEIYSVSCEPRPNYRYELDVLDYDFDTSVFWINEGVGFDWWFDANVDLDQPGFYVVEGITGCYYRGTWGYDDDDEEWEFTFCRRATDEEIRTSCLAERRRGRTCRHRDNN